MRLAEEETALKVGKAGIMADAEGGDANKMGAERLQVSIEE